MTPTFIQLTKLIGFSALLAVSPLARAATVSFAVTGTADTTELGYTAGEVASFSFIVGDNFVNNIYSFTTPTTYSWYEQISAQDSLFSSISGSKLIGSYSSPSANSDDPEGEIRIDTASGSQVFSAGMYSATSNVGLSTPSLSLIRGIGFYIDGNTNGPSFAMLDTYELPSDYFSRHLGSFTVSANSSRYLYLITTSGDRIDFSLNNLIISVPEPSSYAAFFGVVMIAFLRFRRRV